MNFRSKLKNTLRAGWIILLLLAIFSAWNGVAQQKKVQTPKKLDLNVKKINTYYYDKGVLKAVFSSQSVQPLTGPLLLSKSFRMRSVQDGDEKKTELVIEAPECIYNTENHIASSAGPLKVVNAETNFMIEGVGFISVITSTNAQLTISNEVHTLIKGTTTNTIPGSSVIDIYSDHFFFFSEIGSNITKRTATYRKNVRVEEESFQLTCDFLRAELPATGKVLSGLVARDGVVLLNKKDGSKAYGSKATYRNLDGRELIYLEGDPRWVESLREARGDLFVFDKNARTLEILTNAVVTMKNVAMSGLPMEKSASSNQTTVTIHSDKVTVQLSETNGPPELLSAMGSVQIKSDDDSISGRSAEARFLPAKGDLEMFQNARLRVGQSEIHGEYILVNVSNQIVRSTGNSFLRLPNSSISSTSVSPGGSNLFLEIFSDSFSYSATQAEFKGKVNAHYLSGTNVLSNLDAGYLRLDFGTNQSINQMVARESARFRQYPSEGSVSNVFEREIKAGSVQFKFFPGGREMHSFIAEENVFFRQRNPTSTNLNLMQLECGQIYSEFTGQSNQLKRALADGNVRVLQNLDLFRGEKAVFSSETNQSIMVLSGKPFALLNRVDNKGKTNVVEVLDSDVFIWYPERNTFKARGPWRLAQPNSSFGKN